MRKMLSFTEFKEAFKEGRQEYNPAVMWFWNDDINEYEISYQMERFREKDILEFFIHPMFGFRVDYLSERYFQLIRYAVNEARRLGMKFWIYDEYNWPSGSAGGYLLRDKPWTRSLVLRMADAEVAAGGEARLCLAGYDAFLYSDDGNKYPYADIGTEVVFACAEHDGEIWEVLDDVTLESSGESFAAVWHNNSSLACRFMIFYSERSMTVLDSAKWSEFNWNQPGYLDVCNSEAVEEFIKYTHDRYKAAIGSEFGRTVIGVFTDEVAACMARIPNITSGLMPWSRDFAAEFRKRRGYEIKNILSSLFADGSSNEIMAARRDFWRTVSELYTEIYMGITSEWCVKNNLMYTGHLVGEELFMWNLAAFGDLYDSLSYMHMPGLDSILSYQFIDDYSFNIAGKLVASAAHFQGKDRILCEAYTGSGWDCSLRHMKRIANRLLVLGANYIQYMGAYYSIKGFRKLLPGGYPPSHSWNNTLYEHYPWLNRYISRISWLSAKTEPCARVLVMYPVTTARLLLGGSKMWNYTGDYPLRKQDLTVQGVVNSLMTLNQTFEMGFEQLMGEAVVSEGKIIIRGQEYDLLVLPAMAYLTESTLKIVRDFVSCGGRLVMVNDIPLKNGDTMADLQAEELLGPNGNEALSALSRGFAQDGAPFSQVIRGKGNVWLVVTNQFDEDNGKRKKGKEIFTELIKSCFEGITPSILELEPCQGINSCHRKAGNSHFFIIANDNQCKCRVKGRINLPYNAAALDTDSGDMGMIRMDSGNGYTDFEIELDGFESVVLAAGEDVEAGSCLHPETAPGTEILLSEVWKFETLGPNWFVPEAKSTDNLTAGGKFTAVYDFEVRTDTKQLELVIEDDCAADWYINGIRITAFKKERLWDEANLTADIQSFVQAGLNRLVAAGILPAYDAPHSLPFAALRGDFSVENRKLVPLGKEIKPLPWNDQGWPHYAGKAVYRCEAVLGSFNHIELSVATNDVVRVLVNGGEAGIRPWEPYRFDITGMCSQGESNIIEIEITSPYGNLLGQPVPSGLLRPPVLTIR